MTTKRKARGGVKGKVGDSSRPRELYDEQGVQRNPLTGAELAGLAKEVGAYFTANETGASLYLLLLYSLANDCSTRWRTRATRTSARSPTSRRAKASRSASAACARLSRPTMCAGSPSGGREADSERPLPLHHRPAPRRPAATTRAGQDEQTADVAANRQRHLAVFQVARPKRFGRGRALERGSPLSFWSAPLRGIAFYVGRPCTGFRRAARLTCETTRSPRSEPSSAAGAYLRRTTASAGQRCADG